MRCAAPGLVDDVDRLVRQVAVVDVARRELRRRAERVGGVLDAVVGLEAGLQALQDLDRLLDRGLVDVDLLEAPRQRMVLLEHAAVFVVSRGADALQLAGRENRLEQVGGVERAARGRTGADHGVDLVDEQHCVRIVDQLLQDRLQALLEIAAILGAREQRAHVERVDGALGEQFGHAALDDAARQALGDRGLADARLADQQRVVLAPPAKRLDDALELPVAADQRVDLAGERQRVEILGVIVERAVGRLGLALLLGFLLALGGVRLRRLGDAVRDVIDHVQPRDALLLEEVDRVGILLSEDRNQHVGPGHFLLAGGLHVQDGALNHALKAERGLGVDLAVGRDARRLLGNMLRQVLAQLIDVGAAGAQNLRRGGVVQQGKEQVFDGDELVALLARLDERHVKTDFELLGNHPTFPPSRTAAGAGAFANTRPLAALWWWPHREDTPRRPQCLRGEP